MKPFVCFPVSFRSGPGPVFLVELKPFFLSGAFAVPAYGPIAFTVYSRRNIMAHPATTRAYDFTLTFCLCTRMTEEIAAAGTKVIVNFLILIELTVPGVADNESCTPVATPRAAALLIGCPKKNEPIPEPRIRFPQDMIISLSVLDQQVRLADWLVLYHEDHLGNQFR